MTTKRGFGRRTLLTASAAALVAATLGACTEANGAGPGASPTVSPPANTPLISWELDGGYTRPGVLALRPARLVVFGDGEAIADAAYRAQLDDEELQELLDDLVSALKTPDVGKRKGNLTVVDAPVTRIKVWTGTGLLTVTAEALDELRDDEGYAKALYDARDRLGTVHKTVASTAQPYVADRVRVVAEAAGSDASDARTWPSQVTLPPVGDDHLQRADLGGEPARMAVQALTRDLDQRGAWPTYRTGDGRLVQASWRYLLPNE